MAIQLIPGKFYYVKTPGGSDIMKLLEVSNGKAIFSTHNTFGYRLKIPYKITVELNQVTPINI